MEGCFSMDVESEFYKEGEEETVKEKKKVNKERRGFRIMRGKEICC